MRFPERAPGQMGEGVVISPLEAQLVLAFDQRNLQIRPPAAV